MIPFLLSLTAIAAYFLGTVNSAAVLSRLIFRRGIRSSGGGTAHDVYWSFGVPGVVLWVALDVLKSFLAVGLGALLLGTQDQATVGKLFAGFCLMLGHMYPLPSRFRGGKGVLCGGVMAWMVDWRVGLGCWAVFLILVIFTRYVSLGSMAGALFCPIFMMTFGFETLEGLLALLCAGLILFRHAENILRLIGRTEPRLRLKTEDARYGRGEDDG